LYGVGRSATLRTVTKGDAPGKLGGNRRRLTPEKGIIMSLDAESTSRNATPAREPGGFVRFPKPLFDAVMHAPMSLTQRILVLVVYRQTRGHFDHESRELAEPFLATASGLSEKTVARALKPLVAEGVLVEVQPPTNRKGRVLSVQTDPTTWGAFTPAFSGDLGRSAGPPKDGVRMTESPPSPVRESTLGATASPRGPVRESTPGATASPPKNNSHNVLKKEQNKGVANSIGSPRARAVPDADCEAHGILMDNASGLAAHVDPAHAEELFWALCEDYRKLSGGESCAARMPICADGAAELRKNCTNARNPEAYVRKLVAGLEDGSTNLVGKRGEQLWALSHRPRAEDERPDNVISVEELKKMFA